MAKPGELTPKQALFVKHYIATKNATQAARLAGYTGSNQTLEQTGCQNLRNPKIKGAVDKELTRVHEKLDISAERILGRLAEFAFDPTIRDNIAVKALEMLSKNQALLDGQGLRPAIDPLEVATPPSEVSRDELLERVRRASEA